MDWVDLVVIALMLLAAVHGLRLGALVQLLTFGGFWLGFVLGALLWDWALHSVTNQSVRATVSVSLVLVTAIGFSYVGRLVGGYSNVTLRRHHLGNVDAALGVGVAVVAVLLSCWLVSSVISSPNSRFTWLSSAVARSDILHSVDRLLPQAPSVFNELETFLSNHDFPPVFTTLIPPSTGPVATPTDAATRALANPAAFSTVKILGAACNEEQEGSGFVVGHGLVATNAHVVAGESTTQVMVNGSTPVPGHRGVLLRSRLRPGHPADQRPARTGTHRRPQSYVGPGHPGGHSGLPPRTVLLTDRRRA